LNPRQTRHGRHAAPRRRTARRVALGAAAVAAGTVPLAAAGSAQAAVAPPSTSALVARLTPELLQQGPVGTLASGFTPPAQALTAGLVTRANPVVAGLSQAGVPTVGAMTNRLGQSSLPMVGNVDRLTQSLPVDSMLGPGDPLTSSLNDVTRL
jgi:hypothetical protein